MVLIATAQGAGRMVAFRGMAFAWGRWSVSDPCGCLASEGRDMSGRERRSGTAGSGGIVVRLDRHAPRPLAPLALDPQQRAVVEHRDGHLLVLAGPGTGKTATLAELVVARIGDPVDPIPADRILALTFGRRAARELSDRISGRLGGGPVPVVSTFHSFAYGVLRQHADPTAFASPPRLLVAAEQDARLRELLTYSIEEGRLQWPESLSRAVGTRGIAEQVRALLARARGQGLDGKDLTRIGRREGVPVWAALGGFFEEYLATLEFEGSLDYAELILRAAVLANDPRAGRELREAFRLDRRRRVPGHRPGPGRAAARAWPVGAPRSWPSATPTRRSTASAAPTSAASCGSRTCSPARPASPPRIEVLRDDPTVPAGHRGGGLRGPGSGVVGAAAGRGPAAAPDAGGDGRAGAVEVRTFPTAAAEAAGVAETLLRAHAGEPGRAGLAWSQMAVLVRNPAVHGPVLARALRAAGIPCGCPRTRPRSPTSRRSASCCRSSGWRWTPRRCRRRPGGRCWPGPSGGPTLWRSAHWPGRCSRDIAALASRARRPANEGSERPPSSDALLTAALARGELPTATADVPRSALSAFTGLAKAVAAARSAMQARTDGQRGPLGCLGLHRLARAAAHRGPAPRRRVHRGRRPPTATSTRSSHCSSSPTGCRPSGRGEVGTAAFLEDVNALRLPQEVRGAQESDRDHVRLLSAHRAKGLEWELVVVASVQEGQWPDVRLRSDLLHVAELGPRGRIDGLTHADLLAEERRLMYVACTRARSWLVVSAVAERVEGGLQASRFLAELGQEVEAMPARSASPMSAEGLIAALREAAESARCGARPMDRPTLASRRCGVLRSRGWPRWRCRRRTRVRSVRWPLPIRPGGGARSR